jgi:hypothetical protein
LIEREWTFHRSHHESQQKATGPTERNSQSPVKIDFSVTNVSVSSLSRRRLKDLRKKQDFDAFTIQGLTMGRTRTRIIAGAGRFAREPVVECEPPAVP